MAQRRKELPLVLVPGLLPESRDLGAVGYELGWAAIESPGREAFAVNDRA
jgi:hypothetical protein